MKKRMYIHTIEKALGMNGSFDVDMPGEAEVITAILFMIVPESVNLAPVRDPSMLMLPPWVFEFGRISLRAMKNRMFIDKVPVIYIPPACHWNGLDYPQLTTVAKPQIFSRDALRQNIPAGCGVNIMYTCSLDYSNATTAAIFSRGNYNVKIIMEYR